MHDCQSVRPWGLAALATARGFLICLPLCLGAGILSGHAAEADKASLAVFEGPVAAYETVPPVDSASLPGSGTTDVLRWIWVEERMNVARREAPVRVPVFLAAGECRNPDELAIVRWPSREEVVTQADDIRRGTDGGLARLHLWFAVNLGAHEHQRFALVRREPVERTTGVLPVEAHPVGDRLQVQVGGSSVFFNTPGEGKGPLASLHLVDGPILDFSRGAGPRVTWSTAAAAAVSDPATSPGPMLSWGTGKMFAKVRFEVRDQTGATIAQAYRIFRDGSLDVIQTVEPPAEQTSGLTLATQDLLAGELTGNEAPTVKPQTAEIVDDLVGVHRGYVVDALEQAGHGHGWLVIPGSLGGAAGRVGIDQGKQFRLRGPSGLTRGTGDARAGTVRQYWSEVSLIPAKRAEGGLERSAVLAASQPLVAVVERPGVTVAMATARLKDNVLEMKPVGWVNESLIRSLQGKTEPFPRRKWAAEGDPEHWVEGAKRAEAKVMGPTPRRLQEDEKGRAAGSLDPYHITYDTTALVYWLMNEKLPAPVLASNRARMEAVRRQIGRVDESGWPYLDVFSRTQNMQMGPPLLTLADAGANAETRQYYRDLLSAPTLGAVMLRGLRPYQGRAQTQSGESDTLYQAVVDFMLRATELATNESFGLQPVAFGRYLDAIDVNADLCHPAHPRSEDQGGRFARANFFRTQSHLHRWLAWGPAPFFALLRTPPGETDGMFPGATEAWQFADVLSGRWKNWPDQSWLFLSSVLPEKAQTYHPAPRPVAVNAVRTEHRAAGNNVSWEPQPGAKSYRVYRLRSGSPPFWLGSPYRDGGQESDATERVDPDGKPDDRYLVHVIDQAGHESAW